MVLPGIFLGNAPNTLAYVIESISVLLIWNTREHLTQKTKTHDVAVFV